MTNTFKGHYCGYGAHAKLVEATRVVIPKQHPTFPWLLCEECYALLELKDDTDETVIVAFIDPGSQ